MRVGKCDRRVPVHSHRLRQRCRRTYTIQLTATQQWRDGVYVVCNGPSPASSTHHLSTIGSFTVTPSSAVRDLRVYIDSGLSMQGQVQRTVSRCFAVLHQLRTTRQQIQIAMLQLHSSFLDWTIVTAPCLDYTCQPHPAPPVCWERCCTVHLKNPTIITY